MVQSFAKPKVYFNNRCMQGAVVEGERGGQCSEEKMGFCETNTAREAVKQG